MKQPRVKNTRGHFLEKCNDFICEKIYDQQYKKMIYLFSLYTIGHIHPKAQLLITFSKNQSLVHMKEKPSLQQNYPLSCILWRDLVSLLRLIVVNCDLHAILHDVGIRKQYDHPQVMGIKVYFIVTSIFFSSFQPVHSCHVQLPVPQVIYSQHTITQMKWGFGQEGVNMDPCLEEGTMKHNINTLSLLSPTPQQEEITIK